MKFLKVMAIIIGGVYVCSIFGISIGNDLNFFQAMGVFFDWTINILPPWAQTLVLIVACCFLSPFILWLYNKIKTFYEKSKSKIDDFMNRK